MKICAKDKCELQALVDLSIYGKTSAPVLFSDIAKRQDISEEYLEQIANRPHTSGLVKTIRRKKGGYLLNKPESETKLSEIIEILEGPTHVVDCVIKLCLCEKSSLCLARDVWTIPRNKTTKTFFQYILEDLVNAQNDKTGAEALMYYI